MNKIIQPSRSGLKEAATALQQGQLVAFPTETVYGLGGDARAPMAVAAIFDVKQRPTFNPLITHIKDFEAAHALGAFNETASLLARHFLARSADAGRAAARGLWGGRFGLSRKHDHCIAGAVSSSGARLADGGANADCSTPRRIFRGGSARHAPSMSARL